jgi:hypothetical protein
MEFVQFKPLYKIAHWRNKKVNILIDENLIHNWREPIENVEGIKCIYEIIINDGLEESLECMIASFKELEIKGIIINGKSFMKAVYAWSKITIGYALLIWEHNINFFPNTII